MEPHERIILPLDVSYIAKARALVQLLSGYVGVFKIGFEAIYSTMAQLLLLGDEEAVHLLKEVRQLAQEITPERAFIDAKLADIPNTVGKAAEAIASMAVTIFNIHASAGVQVIQAAGAGKKKSLLFGVTVLTSIKDEECISIFGSEPDDKVRDFAEMLVENGADGVICAPKEGLLLRGDATFDDLLIACPNIRPEWAATAGERARVRDDQNVERQMTPGQAIKEGIDMIVIGRPITNPPAEIGGPVEAAKLVAREIEEALARK